MKAGDPVWLVHEVGTSKTMFAATIFKIAPKTIKIRRENFGISSLIFVRNEKDEFPLFERVPGKCKPAYRLENRKTA